MNYDQNLAIRDALEDAANAASKALRAFSEPFGKGPMGLTPDHVKAMPEWKALKASYEGAATRLGHFNRAFLKAHKREWRATLLERRMKKAGLQMA